MKNKIIIWGILIILLLGLSFFVSSSKNIALFKESEIKGSQSKEKLKNSKPDFKLTTLDGKKIVLSNQNSDFILLNFWAIRCPYCLLQIEDLRELDKKYSNSGLKIIGICIDNEKENIREIVDRYNVKYPMVISKRKTPWEFGGINGVPVTFLLDSERNILEKYIGYVSKKEINSDIE